MNVDIHPTVARLVGAPLPAPVRGRDLFGPRSADDVQYAEYADSYALIRRGSKIRVLTGRKPPMSRPVGRTGAPQRVAGSAPHVDGLWNLAADPGEERNLASVRPKVAGRLVIVGEELRRRSLATSGAPPAVDLRERLRQLDYIAPDAPRDE